MRILQIPLVASLLGALLGALLMQMSGGSLSAASTGSAALTLEPASGACNSPIVLRGEGFPVGQALNFIAFARGGHTGSVFANATVHADGTFTVPAEMSRVTYCSDTNPVPVGTQYDISAVTDEGRGSVGTTLAHATYTVTAERLTTRCFVETGQCIEGRLLDHWVWHGGLAINGYPLTDEFDQLLEDGKTYRVQYFERVRLELHPENAPPYDVLLGQFGRRIHPPDPPAAPIPDQIYFAETGHNLGEGFFAYWEARGGLAQFGYPLSEVIEERLEDGNVYRVQFFERARFEYHPENAPPHQILLGQFGRQILAETTR